MNRAPWPAAAVAPRACAVACPRVHDLLLPRDARALHWQDAPPDWAPAALHAVPWVVVRREASRDGRLAVGVRGDTRARRGAAWLDAGDVQRVLRPSELRCLARSLAAPRAALAAFVALRQLELAWGAEAGPADWGPGGSAGFELASGRDTVGPHSDLDVVVRCTQAPALRHARAWLRALPARPATRIDVLLEWPQGGAALADYAGGGEYLLRGERGVVLCRHAAQTAEVA